MTKCVIVDDRERVRATRVEVARLLAIGYRDRLTDWQKATASRLLAQHLKTLPEADRLSFTEEELNRGAGVDWSVLDLKPVRRAIASAARIVVKRYPEKLSATESDLTHAGRLICAERAEQVRRELAKGGYPFLHRWMWQRLVNLIHNEHRAISLDALEAVAGDEEADEWQ